MIEFTVYGEPKGKARPKFSRKGAYTPKATKDYESLVVAAYLKKYGIKDRYEEKKPLYASIVAFMGIPKSDSKRDKESKRSGTIRPTKKPDVDNIAKIVLDALNGLAYKDDNQIVSLNIEKIYSDEPRVNVLIGSYDDEWMMP